MGNNNGKKECTSPYEKKIDEVFSSLSNNSSTVSYKDLKKFWAHQLDPHLYELLEIYLNKECRNGLTKGVFKSLFTGLCKCDEDDRSRNVIRLIGGNETVQRNTLLQFIVSVIKTVLIIQQMKSVKNFSSWLNRTSLKADDSAEGYGNYLLNIIDKDKCKMEFNAEDIRTLLVHFDIFLSMTLAAIYQTESHEFFAHIMPRWKYEPMESGWRLEEVSVLNLVKILFINFELPIDYQDEWRLLFSSAINGESFSRLSGQIINKGPTIIVISDKDGHVFGGFAPDSWNLGPNFTGDSRSFLFALEPEMKLYSPSGFNSNYQYMNVGQQTIPNGLGMGGKLEYFGLWLSADYGSGCCSESCTTYRNYKMMSGTKNFTVAHVEVWGVGPPPPTPAELGERSVLDGNVEAQAILEMAGKSRFSDGLREEPEE